jgi:hypothetical protein
MAEKAGEAGTAPFETTSPVHDTSAVAHDDNLPLVDILPSGWKYKILNTRFGIYYASPKFQLTMVALVCFLCPGMFNALSGMGGGGKANAIPADNMVHTYYSLDSLD